MGAKDDVDLGGILPDKETPARKEPRVSTNSDVKPAKKPATKKAAAKKPLTKEELASEMQRLSERAREAGLSPLRTLLQTYGTLGMGMLEGFLLTLENADESKKKKKK